MARWKWLLAAGISVAVAGAAWAPAVAQQAGRGAGSWVGVQRDAAVPAGFVPRSVTFISGRRGWVLGGVRCGRSVCAALVRTVDGGRSWRSIPAPRARLTGTGNGPGVLAIRFANRLDGFAYGPRLYVTHDGGVRWHRVPVTGGVTALEAGRQTAYAVMTGADGKVRLYRSPVTGDRWSRVAAVPAAFPGFAGQRQLTVRGQAAWVFLGADPRLYATRTGTTWVQEHLPCRGEFHPVSLAAFGWHHVTLLCAAAGLSSSVKAVYASRDGGRHFGRVGTAPAGGITADLAQPGPRHLLLASQAGINWIYASSDGGQTWNTSLVLHDGGKGWTDFGFSTPRDGAVIEGAGPAGTHLYVTRDSGRSWRPVRF